MALLVTAGARGKGSRILFAPHRRGVGRGVQVFFTSHRRGGRGVHRRGVGTDVQVFFTSHRRGGKGVHRQGVSVERRDFASRRRGVSVERRGFASRCRIAVPAVTAHAARARRGTTWCPISSDCGHIRIPITTSGVVGGYSGFDPSLGLGNTAEKNQQRRRESQPSTLAPEGNGG